MAKKKQAEQAEPKKNEWPMEGATVALANGKKPPTVDGVINIGMDHTIHVPSEEDQRSGFTPYIMRGSKHVDATRELLQQYPGVYKPVKPKGETHD
jgi:hypothetical protein